MKTLIDDDARLPARKGVPPARDAAADANPAAEASGPGAQESYYATRKRELPESLSVKQDEIERLRLRQEMLEKQKQALAGLRRKLDAFEEGRRDLQEKLGRSAVLLSREEARASRMATLCAESRLRFEQLKADIATQNPENWSEEGFEPALTQALAQIEAARQVYRRTLDRVNASDWQEAGRNTVVPSDAAIGVGTMPASLPKSFRYWLVAGVAFSIVPALLTLLLLGVLAWRLGWWV